VRTTVDIRKGKLVAGLLVGLAGVLWLAAGCARYPTQPGPVGNRRLIVEMRVAGAVDPELHYFVAFDLDDDAADGPLPVAGQPWGNGWGAGAITHFVQYDQTQPGGYGVHRIVPNTDLLGWVYLGQPLAFTPPGGSGMIAFTLDLDLIDPGRTAQSMQINFITCDVIPIDPDWTGARDYDGLGPSGNDYVTISLTESRVYTNDDLGGLESSGDCPNENLDIVDWSVEVSIEE
jgi:hypothetical protein